MEQNEHNEISEEVVVTKDAVVVTKQSRDLFLPISILIAAAMVVGAIVFSALYRPAAAPATTGGTQQAGGTGAGPTSTAVNPAVMNLGPRDAILGSANAPVTLIEYGDYQCPFCGEFYSQTEPQIIQNYVNTGKIKMVFRNYAFLGAESTAAAEAADCAEDQNKLWAYHDALYSGKVADDAKGGGEDDGFFSTAELLKLGQQVGLNMTQFNACVSTNQDGSLVSQEKASGTYYGVNSTPSFFINGTMITGAQPYAIFQQALDAAVKG